MNGQIQIPAAGRQSEEMQPLRRLIVQLASQSGLDLSDRRAVRRFLDDEVMTGRGESVAPEICRELRAMLILLYRLEASSSEDLGVDGLIRLWHQHGEIIARFQSSGIAAAR